MDYKIPSYEPSFCPKCGVRTVAIHTHGFDPQTGQPRGSLVCPSGSCGHAGHHHDWKWRGFFAIFGGFARDLECTKCGELSRADEY